MITRKLIGEVSISEKDEIQFLFERKNGLLELAKVIQPEDAIYDRLIEDISSITAKYHNWWDRMSTKYKWELVDNSNWRIDFDTCRVYLICN